MLGIKDKIKHDIGEYLEGKIDILTATTKVETVENLYLVCATRHPFIDINPEKIMGVCEEMRQHFDYTIIDTAGVGSSVFSVIKAAELIEDGRLDGFVAEKYSSFNSGIGAKIVAGETSLEELAAYAAELKNTPAPISGKQERLEGIVNSVLFS
jgi:hypothetical protein